MWREAETSLSPHRDSEALRGGSYSVGDTATRGCGSPNWRCSYIPVYRSLFSNGKRVYKSFSFVFLLSLVYTTLLALDVGEQQQDGGERGLAERSGALHGIDS